MARELLLEIGVEEIPSAYMSRVLNNLQDLAAKKFTDERIPFTDIQVMGTPRRLTLIIKNLEEKQEDALIEKRGPKKSAAYDAEGKTTKALQGFARSQGLDIRKLHGQEHLEEEGLQLREVSGVEYYYAFKKEKGQRTKKLLAGILVDIINTLTFPKSMRWAYYNTRFARPLRWLLAFYGKESIEMELENVKSAKYTYGHRFLSSGPIEVNDLTSYLKALEENHVILNQKERKKMIWEQVKFAAAQAGGVPMENEELLEEVTYLLEYPTAFYGEFSASYLDVPQEVLTTSMIEHQRYFPVFDQEGKLLPVFIGVRNGTDYCLELVKAGNERVLKARLEDALFFWKEDIKKPLKEMVPGLKNVLFHERLGSIMDKVERLEKLSLFIAEESGLSTEEKLQRAAKLCKADLLSNMVYEFPELQGIMGRYYALHSGEDQEVCEAIYEHYLPRFAGDHIPASETGMVLSLAEKIDNLVGSFSIGIKPTGSQDPYALRRQTLGIVNIILDKKLNIHLDKTLEKAYESFESIEPDSSKGDIVAEVMDFIMQRMRGVLLDRGLSYDVIDTVTMLTDYDLNNIFKKANSIRDFRQSEYFDDFMTVYNRSHNLSRNWSEENVIEEFLIDESEKKLYDSFSSIKDEVKQAIIENDYYAALQKISILRPDLDVFFEAVMVMVDDEQLKAARLGILKSIANLCHTIGDFGKIVQ